VPGEITGLTKHVPTSAGELFGRFDMASPQVALSARFADGTLELSTTLAALLARNGGFDFVRSTDTHPSRQKKYADRGVSVLVPNDPADVELAGRPSESGDGALLITAVGAHLAAEALIDTLKPGALVARLIAFAHTRSPIDWAHVAWYLPDDVVEWVTRRAPGGPYTTVDLIGSRLVGPGNASSPGASGDESNPWAPTPSP
jgi:hypothetical protein